MISSFSKLNSTLLIPTLLLITFFVFPAKSENSTEICSLFTDIIHENEFTSPLYPEPYPPNVVCTRIIEAPNPSSVIRLHFIETFQMEDEDNCGNDYLEIRDGQFGYSSLLRKLCGSIPPSFIESSGPWLWIRFKSDKNIEGAGFKIMVDFAAGRGAVSAPGCSVVINATDLTNGTITTPDDIPEDIFPLSLEPVIDCTWIITVPLGYKIFLQFNHYNLERPNDCGYNFVEVYGNKTELEGQDGLLKSFCSSDKDYVTSNSNVIHFRFYTEMGMGGKLKGGVGVDWNIFREGDSCNDTEFNCNDGTCIPITLKCDGNENCKSRGDEDIMLCGAKNTFQLKTNILLIAFLGILLMSGMCSGLMLKVFRKLQEDNEKREEIRKSTTSLVSNKSMNKSVTFADGKEKILEMRDSACQTYAYRPADLVVYK